MENRSTTPLPDPMASSPTHSSDPKHAPQETVGPMMLQDEFSSDEAQTEKLSGKHDANATNDNIRKITGIRWVLVCLGLYATALMYGLDTTIAADIQAAVIDTYDEVTQLAWIGAGFPLGSVGVILPYGALYANFNMKWLCIGGIALFQAGSALCGAAPTMNALIVGRVLAGAGGTGMYLGTLNMLSAMTAREERARYVGGIGVVWGVGAILGPVVGGGFSVSSATWRWGFYINLVVGAVTAPIYLIYLPAVLPADNKTTKERLMSLDFIGFVLSAVMWTTFSMPLVSGGGIWAWNDAKTIALLVVCGVVTILYVVQQYFCIFTTPERRSFPGHLLKSRTQVLVYICTACSISTLFVVTYYIPLYFQFVQNDSALMAAVRLLPYLTFTIVFNLLSGNLLGKVKYYMVFYLVAGLMMTICGALLFVYLEPSTSAAKIYGVMIIGGVGTGLTIQLGYSVASLTVGPSDVVNAVNLQNIAQMGSSVICLVSAAQVFQSVAVTNLTSVLAGQGFSEAIIKEGISGVHSALFASLEGELRDAAILAITGAMQRAFILVIVAGALQTASAAAMKFENLFA